MRFEKSLVLYGRQGKYCTGVAEDGKTYTIFSLAGLPADGGPIKVVDSEEVAIVPMGDITSLKSIEDFRDVICQDKFILIYTALAYQDADKGVVENITHDILKYRHMYVARESGSDISRAVDAYNTRQFLNQYRNLVINTNAYGKSKEEKAPYLRFIDGEGGAFDLLRRYEEDK